MLQRENQHHNKLILMFNTQPKLPSLLPFRNFYNSHRPYFKNCLNFCFGLTVGNFPFFHVYSLLDISNLSVKASRWPRLKASKEHASFLLKALLQHSSAQAQNTSTTVFKTEVSTLSVNSPRWSPPSLTSLPLQGCAFLSHIRSPLLCTLKALSVVQDTPYMRGIFQLVYIYIHCLTPDFFLPWQPPQELRLSTFFHLILEKTDCFT